MPNDQREDVVIRDLLESRAFKREKGALTLALGKDIAGNMGMWPKLLILGGLLSMLGGGLTGSRGLGGMGGIMMLLGLAPTLFKALTGGKSKDKAEKVIDPGAASTINKPVEPVRTPAPAGP